jgi:hypothetical protein
MIMPASFVRVMFFSGQNFGLFSHIWSKQTVKKNISWRERERKGGEREKGEEKGKQKKESIYNLSSINGTIPWDKGIPNK